MKIVTILILIILHAIVPLYSSVIYVNGSATGTNNGSNWENAFTNLTMALSSATPGDEIWVASGVYRPETLFDLNSSGGTDLREATFVIPDEVSLYGGFSGTEASRSERNWNLHHSILSGDIDNNDINVDGDFIANSADDLIGNNAYHVVYIKNASEITRIDGFIITAGKADFPAEPGIAGRTDRNRFGGGLYNYITLRGGSGSAAIKNTEFIGNYASESGAGMFVNGNIRSSMFSSVENCSFTNNKSGDKGGAVYIFTPPSGRFYPKFLRCTFTGNEALRRGGALAFAGDSSRIDSCFFLHNRTTITAPSVAPLGGAGGAVSLSNSSSKFNRCIFKGNSSTGSPASPFRQGGGGGGAIAIYASYKGTRTYGHAEPRFFNCGFYDNSTGGNGNAWGGAITTLNDGGYIGEVFINCVFAGNLAQNDGGAIAIFQQIREGSDTKYSALYTNCTFNHNRAGKRGGAIFSYMESGPLPFISDIENCIFWNDLSGDHNEISGNRVIHQATNSIIEGSGGSGSGWNAALAYDAGFNIDENPRFVNESSPEGRNGNPGDADDGLNLNLFSPAINAGFNYANGLYNYSVITDFKGAPRIQGENVDIGAYETPGVYSPGILILWLNDWFNPFCNDCQPWSLILSEKSSHRFSMASPAQFVDYGNYAMIKGNITDITNKANGFKINIKLINKNDWKEWSAKNRTYVTHTPEAGKVADIKHSTWSFWELSDESYLEGTGNISGKVYLKHFPADMKTGFQLGEGGNGWNEKYGFSGTFSYAGSVTFMNKTIKLAGFGSLNTDAELCNDCIPAQLKSTGSDELPVKTGKGDFKIFPVPAKEMVTLLPGNNDNLYQARIFDMQGRLVKYFETRGEYSLNVSGLSKGIYIIHISYGDTVLNKRIVIE